MKNSINKVHFQYTPAGQGQDILITRADGLTRKYKYSRARAYNITPLANIANCWRVRWDEETMKREAIR